MTASASSTLCNSEVEVEAEGEEVTTEPIPDLVLNGVHEDDDECDRQKEQVKVPNEVERSAETSPAVDSHCLKEESTLKPEETSVEFTPDTHLNGETTLGEVESSSSSSNNSTSVTPTVIVVETNSSDVKVSETSNTSLTSEKTGNITCKQEQIGEETAKVVLGDEEVETAPSNESSSSDDVNDKVNNIYNNNTLKQHNNNNNNTLNEANNNHSSPKVEMKSETNDISTPNGVPISATVTVAPKLTTNGITNGAIDSPDGRDSAGDSIPASPTSIKSATSSNASSNGGSSTGGSLTNGSLTKRSSLTGIIDPNLEMSLNMSVSEMRQFLAQKKKHDPKKAPMDFKQKYEIISSL